MLEKLDCFFVGDRPYIQGSQIIALCSNALINLNKEKEITLEEAKFTSITANEVFISDSKQEDLDVIGQVEFSINKEPSVLFVLTNNTEVATRVADAPTFEYQFTEKEELHGLIEFNTHHASFELLLCTFIAANKKLHSDLSESSHDVWFTGLRRASIPTSAKAIPASGKIKFKHLMTAGKGSHQTMSEVTISGSAETNNIEKFIISFAYKS